MHADPTRALPWYVQYTYATMFLEPYRKGQLRWGWSRIPACTVPHQNTAYKMPVNYYSTGGRGILVPDLDQPDINQNSNEPYLDFLHYILQQDVLPQTITNSYGEDEQSVPSSYATEVCSLFGQLGARGVSVGRCFFFFTPL